MKTNRTVFSYLIALALVMIALAFSSSVHAGPEPKYQVDQSVDVHDSGSWYKGIILKVDKYDRSVTYHVHCLGHSSTSTLLVGEQQLRPADSGPTEPVGKNPEPQATNEARERTPRTGP